MAQRIARRGTDGVYEAIDQLESDRAGNKLRPFGEHAGIFTGSKNCAFDRLYVFNTSSTDGTALLPPIGSGDLGRALTVYNSGSGSVTVKPQRGASVRGVSSDSITRGASGRCYVAMTQNDWGTVGGGLSWTGRTDADLSSADLTQAGMSFGAWTDWDISSIIGSTRKVVAVVSMAIRDNSSTSNFIAVRPNGKTAAEIDQAQGVDVTNQQRDTIAVVETDSSGILEYYVATSPTLAKLSVLGWFEVNA